MYVNKLWNMLLNKLEEWVSIIVLMLPNLALAVLIVTGSFLLARLGRILTSRIVARFSRHDSLNKLFSQLAFIMIVSFGVFVALGILQLDKAVTSLLAGVGILGLALGFAFQDIASNFISGIIIIFTHPFRVNDLIESNDYKGVVKKINFRTTDIMTLQGQVVLIPNKEVFQKPLKNYTASGSRRVDLEVGVSYGEDLDKVMKTAYDAVLNTSGRESQKPPELFFKEFGDSGICQ